MRIDYAIHRLMLKKPVSVSRETHRAHDTVLVRLTDGDDTGYGEATEFSVYGASKANIVAALKKAQTILADEAFTTPQAVWDLLQPGLSHEPFALSAIDVAAWDLCSKRLNQPLRRVVGGTLGKVTTSITLGLSRPKDVSAYVDLYGAWPRIKLKLGNEWDIENILALANAGFGRHQGDVNGGWSLAHARTVLNATPRGAMTFIEQLLPTGYFFDMARLKSEFSEQLFIADEDFRDMYDLPFCATAYGGVNLKLMKCGGITPSLKLIGFARRLGLKASIGCMPESSVGASAIAHIAHLFDYADFDSIDFMANDPFRGIRIDEGAAVFNDEPGLGVEDMGQLEWLIA